MINISDSNRFDLDQAHAQDGLACGHQRHLSEDKGSESKVPPQSLALSCVQEIHAQLNGQDSRYHPSQLSAPFQEDPSKFEGLWQVRWSRVSPWGGFRPSVMETQELSPLPLVHHIPALCRQHPRCVLASLLAPGGIFSLFPVVFNFPQWLSNPHVSQASLRTWHRYQVALAPRK